MSGITSQGPGFVTFAAPPSLSFEEMGQLLRDESGAIPPLNRIPTAKKAAVITSGLALTPILGLLGSTGLLDQARIFFHALFGGEGDVIQERAANEFLVAAGGGPIGHKGIDELLNSKNPEIIALRDKVVDNAEALRNLAGDPSGIPGFSPLTGDLSGMSGFSPSMPEMTEEELSNAIENFKTKMLVDIKRGFEGGYTAKEIKDNIRHIIETGMIPTELIPSEYQVDLMIESVVSGMQQPAFAANPTASTDGTQPDQEVRDATAELEAIMNERDRRKKEDELLGLKVGQKTQQLDNIERSPDQWLARVQAMRQALFARETPRTPMQMTNDGLVQQVYYSTRVQQ